MKIAFYNQMFAMDGRSFFKHLKGHYSVYLGNKNGMLKKQNAKDTFELIHKFQPDVIGLTEVLDFHEQSLIKMFKKSSYNYSYFNKGIKNIINNVSFKMGIISKQNAQFSEIFVKKKFNAFTQKLPIVYNMLQAGCGVIHAYLKKKKIHIIVVHFPFWNELFFRKQAQFLKDYLLKMEKNEKVIIIGDFNKKYNKIKNYLPGFSLASQQHKTCSVTPILKWFKYEDLDHVFVKNLKVKRFIAKTGKSDHKMIMVEIDE